MSGIDYILSCLRNPIVQQRYVLFKKLKKEQYPDMNYVGINFKGNDVVSVKIYFSFFHNLKEEDILKYIPTSADYNRYIHLWRESTIRNLEHSGCAFTIKFKPGKPITYGFHYRITPSKEAYDLIGRPNNIPFKVDDLGTRPGINYEYNNNETVVKRYYYFDKDDHREYFAKRFNNPFALNLHLIEYTESDKFSKAIFWRMEYADLNFNRPQFFAPEAEKIVKEFRNKYGLINMLDGYYENDNTIATYFFNTVKNEHQWPFDVPENFQIDTLKLFL
jgi:hypothetical protein